MNKPIKIINISEFFTWNYKGFPFFMYAVDKEKGIYSAISHENKTVTENGFFTTIGAVMHATFDKKASWMLDFHPIHIKLPSKMDIEFSFLNGQYCPSTRD